MDIHDPIEYLRQQFIRVTDSLQVLVMALEGMSGERSSPETLDLLLGAAEEVRDGIWTHSERVKAVLLPVLEPKLGNDGIVSVLLGEHRAYHRGLGTLTRLIRDLKEDPLRGDLRKEIAESIHSLAEILPGSIKGEDEAFYPLARRLLPEEKLKDLARRVAAFELEKKRERETFVQESYREVEELKALVEGPGGPGGTAVKIHLPQTD